MSEGGMKPDCFEVTVVGVMVLFFLFMAAKVYVG